MALKNKDLLFVIKVQNQARAALAQLRGDLTGVGKAGSAGVTGIRAQERALESLRKKAIQTRQELARLASAGNSRGRTTTTAGSGNSRGGGGPGGSARNTNLQALSRAARAAATNLDRVARSRAGRGGAGGGRTDPGLNTRESNIALRELSTAARRAANALDRLGRARPPGGGGGGAAGGAAAGAAAGRFGGLGAIVGGAAVVGGIAAYAKLSDEFKNLYARVSLTTQGVEEQETVFTRITGIANGTRQSLEGTVVTYYRMAQAGKNLGLEQEKVYRATELVSKAVTISGASADAAKGALIQLGQGLGSGTLRGEELNSVLEQTPRLAEALAAGIGFKSVSALRKFAQEGKLTSETVINALLSQGAALDREFGQFPVTIGQAMTVLRNNVVSTIGEIEQDLGTTSGIAQAILNIGLMLRDPEVLAAIKDFVSILGTGLQVAATLAVGAIKLIAAVMPALKVALAIGTVAFISMRVAAILSLAAIRAALVRMVVAFTAAMRALAVAALTNPIGILLVALGAVIALMAVFSNKTVEINGEQTTLGDILAEAWERLVGAIQVALGWIGTASSAISSFFGGVSDDSTNTGQSIYDTFKSVANFLIATFMSVGQTIGLILAGIINGIMDVGRAGGALLDGDFAGAAAAAKSFVMAPIKTGKAVVDQVKGNYGTDYVGGTLDSIVKGAAQRTKKRGGAQGGIATDPTGTDPTAGGKGKKSGKSAADAAKELANELKQLQSTYDPLRAKTREFDAENLKLTRTLAMSDAALKALGFTREDITRIAENAKRKQAEELDIMFEFNKQAREQIRLLGFATEERDIEQAMIDLENKAREQNVQLTKEQTNAYRAQQIQLREFTKLDEARTAVRGAVETAQDELAVVNEIGGVRDRMLQVIQFMNGLRRDGVKNEQEIVRLGNEYTAALQAQASIAARNDMAQRLQDIDTEIRLSGVLEGSRERVNALLEYENYIRDQGLEGTAEGIRLMQTYAQAIDAATQAEAAARADWKSGIREGLQELTQQWSDMRNAARDFITNTFSSLSDTLQGFLKTGKISISSFIQGIGQDLIKIGVNGLMSKATGALDKLFGTKNADATKPTSILDRYLLANKAVPVMIQNIGALGTLTGAANDNGLGGIISNLVGGGAKSGGKTGGAGGGGLLDVARSVLEGNGGGDAKGGGKASGLLGVASGILGEGGGGAGGLLGIAASILGGGAGGGAAGGIMGLLSGILGGGGGGAGGLGGLLSFGLSMFKDGGVMTDRGNIPLRKYSGGGIARSPQLAMFGEGSVPEAYVPVPSGRIPVEMRGSGMGGSVVNMTINTPDANSFRKSRGQIASEMASELSRQGGRNS